MNQCEVQRDIELCESVLCRSVGDQKDAYYLLLGKYKDLPLSQAQKNPLYLKTNPSEYRNIILVIKSYLQTLMRNNAIGNTTNDEKGSDYSRVFIVHGHNEALKQAVARLIERQGIKAIILHEQPNIGATIIEKFEHNCGVGAAICLFTADDTGKAKKEENMNTRARQNVVFEAGFFMGSLGRDHVILIAEQGVEMPSDLNGIVYTNSTSWQMDVLKELRAIGFSVDLNKLD